ncbi:MAG: hypothetical protein ACRD12_16235 [Acidimicrobiales bacterium]
MLAMAGLAVEDMSPTNGSGAAGDPSGARRTDLPGKLILELPVLVLETGDLAAIDVELLAQGVGGRCAGRPVGVERLVDRRRCSIAARS